MITPVPEPRQDPPTEWHQTCICLEGLFHLTAAFWGTRERKPSLPTFFRSPSSMTSHPSEVRGRLQLILNDRTCAWKSSSLPYLAACVPLAPKGSKRLGFDLGAARNIGHENWDVETFCDRSVNMRILLGVSFKFGRPRAAHWLNAATYFVAEIRVECLTTL